MSGKIIDFATGAAEPADVVDVDVEAVAARLRAAYVQAFDDTVAVALRWASTGERRQLEGNFESSRSSNILERIRAEGQVARLQRHAQRIAPESLARQLAKARATIAHCEDFERQYYERKSFFMSL